MNESTGLSLVSNSMSLKCLFELRMMKIASKTVLEHSAKKNMYNRESNIKRLKFSYTNIVVT